MEAYIFSDGSVGLCCCDVKKTFNFRIIQDKSIFEIFNGKKLQSIRKKIINGEDGLDFCKYCDFESKGGRRLKFIIASLDSLGGEIIYNNADFQLVSSKVLDKFSEFEEVNLFFRELFLLVGLKVSAYTMKGKNGWKNQYGGRDKKANKKERKYGL